MNIIKIGTAPQAKIRERISAITSENLGQT